MLPPGCLVDGELLMWAEGRLDFGGQQQRSPKGRTRELDTSTRGTASGAARWRAARCRGRFQAGSVLFRAR